VIVDYFRRPGDADDTDSFRRAFASGRKKFRLAERVYTVSRPIDIRDDGVSLVGANQYSTVIRQTRLDTPTLVNGGSFNQFENLAILYDGRPVAGATAVQSSGSNTQLRQFIIRNCHKGLEFVAGSAQMATNFQIFDYEEIGIFVHDVNDVYVSDFILNAGTEDRGTLGGLRLQDRAEAVLVSRGDVLLGQWSMTTDAGLNAIGTRPAYNNFTDVFFDSSANGVLLERIVESGFSGCWFSGGRTGRGRPGLTMNYTDSMTFTDGTRFFNNGGNGCLVQAGARRTLFSTAKFESNSVTAGRGVCHGLTFGSGTTDFTVLNCIAHNGLYPGEQGYGIFIDQGNSNRYIVADNLVSGNVRGGVLDRGRGVDKRVASNF
jgi:Right handed beta helix region